MAEFIVLTWTMIQNQWEQHEENIKKNIDYWRKNAKHFKLKSMRYFAQALGGDSFHYGRVLVLFNLRSEIFPVIESLKFKNEHPSVMERIAS